MLVEPFCYTGHFKAVLDKRISKKAINVFNYEYWSLKKDNKNIVK